MNRHKTTKVNIRLEEEIYNLLQQMTTDNNTSLSEIIRYLIKEGLHDIR